MKKIYFIIVAILLMFVCLKKAGGAELLGGINYIPPEIDEETGCELKSWGDNARIEYEQCRQSYYLSKQVELLESQTASHETLSDKETIISDLSSANQEFRNLLDSQNKITEDLIDELDQQNQRINSLNNSLKSANVLNIVLSILSLFLLLLSLNLLFKKKIINRIN